MLHRRSTAAGPEHRLISDNMQRSRWKVAIRADETSPQGFVSWQREGDKVYLYSSGIFGKLIAVNDRGM